MPLDFPGGVLRRNSDNPALVMALQRRLNALRCGSLVVDGHFGQATEDAVRLFQARTIGQSGHPLLIDGEVGPETWRALFPTGEADASPMLDERADLALAVLRLAEGEVGIMEEPPGSNRGPRVDQYIRTTGLHPAEAPPWCVCFIYWCYHEAAGQLDRPNPLPKTASVHDLWQRSAHAARRRTTADEASAEPQRVVPGMIFFIDTGGGKGHAGLVLSRSGRSLVTIEGNTNGGGSREGVGVFKRSARSLDRINLGYALF
jgi:hypothetical protein